MCHMQASTSDPEILDPKPWKHSTDASEKMAQAVDTSSEDKGFLYWAPHVRHGSQMKS